MMYSFQLHQLDNYEIDLAILQGSKVAVAQFLSLGTSAEELPMMTAMMTGCWGAI